MSFWMGGGGTAESSVKREAGQSETPAGCKSNPIQTRPNVDILAIHGAVKVSEVATVLLTQQCQGRLRQLIGLREHLCAGLHEDLVSRVLRGLFSDIAVGDTADG